MNPSYSIARLSAWSGRSFDLDEVGDWLDALDDFGPALIRFLLDETCAGEIPDADPALAALKSSMLKSPLSELKPTRGSVWILFAYKDRLRRLPPPFRRDGVLLPFAWERRDDASGETPNGDAHVPAALAALAGRVRAQLGASEGWRLVPAAYFGGQVDFALADATFDSAWGALASGLALATSPKIPFSAWPFSSVAFDFERGEPAPVGGLEAKFAVAASFGAGEIAVAPVQLREARKVLAELRKQSRDRALARMRVFPWRWTGDVASSVRALVRCNQETPARRRVRLLAVNFAWVAAIMAFALMARWDRTRTVTEFFGDSVNVRGVPTGLFPRGKGGAGYRFAYSGREGWLPFAGRRILREVVCVGADGAPANDPTERPEHRHVATRSFFYSEDGRLRETRHCDAQGNAIDAYRYSGRDLEVVDVCRIGDDEVVRLGTVQFTAVSSRKGDSVGRIVCRRDECGRVVEIACQRGMAGESATSGSGISVTRYGRDGLGRIVSCRYFSAEGAAVTDGRGVHEKRYAYDGECLAIQERFGVDGRMMARIEYAGDVRSKMRVMTADGGWDEHAYDGEGRVTSVEYRSRDGELVADREGVARVEYVYENGVRRELFFDLRGDPVSPAKSRDNQGVNQ